MNVIDAARLLYDVVARNFYGPQRAVVAVRINVAVVMLKRNIT